MRPAWDGSGCAPGHRAPSGQILIQLAEGIPGASPELLILCATSLAVSGRDLVTDTTGPRIHDQGGDSAAWQIREGPVRRIEPGVRRAGAGAHDPTDHFCLKVSRP